MIKLLHAFENGESSSLHVPNVVKPSENNFGLSEKQQIPLAGLKQADLLLFFILKKLPAVKTGNFQEFLRKFRCNLVFGVSPLPVS